MVVLVMLVGTAGFAHAAPPAALNAASDFIVAPLEAIGSPNAATDASEAIFPTNANRSDLSVTTPESEPLVVEAEIDFFGGMPTPPADRILRMQSLAMLNDPAALFRAALTATEQEDFSHADWLYAQIVGKHPVVGDHAGLLRARLQLDRGRAAEARQIATATLAAFSESPLRAQLHELVGLAYVAERDEPGAREAWAAALA